MHQQTLDWIINTENNLFNWSIPAFDGLYYIYTETSGAGSNSNADITVDCVDFVLTNPFGPPSYVWQLWVLLM